MYLCVPMSRISEVFPLQCQSKCHLMLCCCAADPHQGSKTVPNCARWWVNEWEFLAGLGNLERMLGWGRKIYLEHLDHEKANAGLEG